MTDTMADTTKVKRGRGRPKGSRNKRPAPVQSAARGKQTIASIIRSGLLDGKTPDQIIAAVRKTFPDARTTAATVHNYRRQLRKEGFTLPTVRASRKSRGKVSTRRATPARRTITLAIREALLAGKNNDETLEAVKKEFPSAKTSRNTVVIQRSKLRKEGKPIPSSWEANRARQSADGKGLSAKAAKTVAIASDHAGTELKTALKKLLREKGLVAMDLGTMDRKSVDYTDFAHAVAEAMNHGLAARGVIICGSGIGISIAANRHKHVRAALCTSGLMARLARRHNDANVLALGARLTGIDIAKDCLAQFLDTEFEGGRHQRRIDKMS